MVPGDLSLVAQSTPRSGIRDVFDDCELIPDVITFAVGEPAESVPERAAKAACEAISRGDTHYTNVLGVPEFRAAAVAYTKRAKGLEYDAETEAQAVPGATFGLYLALRALLNPGDEVIIPSPHFTSYDAQVLLCEGRPVTVPLRPENGMRLNAEDIERAVTSRSKVVIVNSPGNPTGAVTSAAELERIAQVCQRHGLWVISDEVYHAFVYGDAPVAPSIASCPGMRDQTVIVDSLSKTYAMTGWRIGYLLGPSALVEETAKIAELIHSSNNTPAQFAGVAALNGLDADIARMRDAYAVRRDAVLSALQDALNLRAVAPDGAFYVFVDVRDSGLDSAEFSSRLLQQEHVAVVPGEAFGPLGQGFVRISYAGDLDEIVEGMGRLVRFANQLD
ncbi:MAG: pyridoxal phosphate-dependent aminotransferase [Pseudoclavibacter sp.]